MILLEVEVYFWYGIWARSCLSMPSFQLVNPKYFGGYFVKITPSLISAIISLDNAS